jgi:putative DNA primase/helicase
MAHAMNHEQTRLERFIAYTAMLKERFESGMLAGLQDLNQWVVWRAELEDGKPKKVPYNPHYSHLSHIQPRASVKIPKSLGTLDAALHALETGNYSGLGFMLTSPLVMVDLDHSYDRQRRTITDPQAEEIIHTLDSYTEASPGSGLHVLAYGSLPGKNIHTAIEIYSQDRFTTITTDHITGTPTSIEHRQDAINALYSQFAPPVTETIIQNIVGGVGSGSALTDLPPEAEHDAVLQRLLSGDITGYQSASNADFVLVLKLLHWTGDNVELTRRLFLESGLFRPEKTERKTGETTFLDMTINNAIRKRRNPSQKRY